MNEWKLKTLHDFIRGRGRPIVERVPLDTSEDSETLGKITSSESSELIDLMNSGIMSQGGMMKSEPKVAFPSPPQPITQISKPEPRKVKKLRPSSKSTETSKKPISTDDYKQLAKFIQMYVDQQQKIKQSTTTPMAITTTTPIKSVSQKKPRIIVSPIPDNQWTTMEEENEDVVEEEEDITSSSKNPKTTKMISTEEIHKQKMNKLSNELSKVLKQLGESRQPQVHVLRNGSAEQTSNGQYIFIATITLIKDGDKYVMVDTGLGTNINERTKLLQAIENLDITPEDINIVVTTHGHPDHVGGLHDFPNALHYQSFYSHYHTVFNLTSLFEAESLNLSENIMLVKAKGHTSDDIAVIVRNAKGFGDVLVAGDLFIRGEDIDHPMMWKPLSADIVNQRDSRRRYGCIVDWIIPGHGEMFEVTSNVKRLLKC
ncbi:unnamed protein product [Caenorhabditis angaria]|uniref:Metallo-beta-lactamase domain-containing protein 1 n=1 Tax=Caenorhabditis angaria TaxID=860376 RepID=A0A9P1NC16_9PELO|nr:unnamed protein product [Caenorhabditis angaria]